LIRVLASVSEKSVVVKIVRNIKVESIFLLRTIEQKDY
jgi:hypothetical protein